MLEIIAIVGISLLSLLLLVKRFDVSVYLLLILSVLLHKELFSFYTWDLLPIRLFGFALILSLAINLKSTLSNLKKNLKDPFILFIIVSWFIYAISIWFSLNVKASLLLLGFYTAICALVYKLVPFLKQNPNFVEKYLKFYVFLTFGLTLFGYFQAFLYLFTGKIIGALWNVPNNIPRVGSTFWDVNHYGALLASMLPVAGVYTLLSKTWKSRNLYGFITLSLTVSLFLTNSRTAWLVDMVAFILFMIILFYRKAGVRGFAYVFVGIALVTLPILVMYADKNSPVRTAIRSYFHYRMDSFDSHMLLLQGTFEIFQKYPYLGGGYGGFFEHFSNTKISSTFYGRDPAAFSTRVPAHTIWGELLSGSGILGFTTYFSLCLLVLGVLFYGALTEKTPDKFLMSAAMSSVYVGLHIAGIFYSYNSEFFWIITILFFTWGYTQHLHAKGYSELLTYFMRSKKLPVIVLSIISAVLIFANLGNSSLIPWDEAIYAKIAKNMYLTGDLLNMYWKPGLIWYEKPPLYMWMTAALMHIFGAASLAPRIPSAIFGFSTILLVYFFTKKHFGKLAAFIAGFSLLTTTQYLYYTRAGMLDVTVGFFISAALISYYTSFDINSKAKSRICWILSGLLIGLGTMVKGVIGLLPFPIILISELVYLKRIRLWEWLSMGLAFLLVMVPWHLYMYERYGMAFIQNYLGYHVLDRALTAIEDKGRPFYWYLIVLKVSMRLWFISLIPAVLLSIYKALKGDKVFGKLTIWAVFILVFFSAAKSKLVWYIIPLYPVLAIINGYFVSLAVSWLVSKVPSGHKNLTRALIVYMLVIVSGFYLTLNYKMVFPGDLTGSQVRLMQKKDVVFGTKNTIYLDRIELPLALYYSDSPFEIVDFVPDQKSRIPQVAPTDPLILMTKKGRYAEHISGYVAPATVVAEDGDYILWYMPPKVPGLFKPPVLD